MDLLTSAEKLRRRLKSLSFAPPVTHVYNPLEYAFASYQQYLERFGRQTRDVVLLGMNPGPWGMAQTGIPFGEVSFVRDWLRIHERIRKPSKPHPKRPVHGLACERSEVSGARLWGWAHDRFGTPERFFRRFFIANYCPLAFMEESGKNRTPDKLPVAERQPLFAACDEALVELSEHLEPKWVIGVGAFAEARAREALADRPIRIGRVLHPSPASPLANRGWDRQATAELQKLGIDL